MIGTLKGERRRTRTGRTRKTVQTILRPKRRYRKNATLATFGANPGSRKDFEYMAALIANLHLNQVPQNCLSIVTDFAVEVGKKMNPRFDPDRFVRRIVQLVGEKRPFRYVNNPNGRGSAKHVQTFGRVIEIGYQRSVEPDKGKFLKHEFEVPMNLTALSDGTLAVWHPTIPAWGRE